MVTRRQELVSNMAWNWAGTLAEAATGFVLAPLLLWFLGEHDYGLWILLGSIATYIGLLDLGVRGSVGRYVAFYRAQGDRNAVSSVVRVGLVLSTAAAVVVLLLRIVLERAFISLFDIAPQEALSLRVALWVVLLTLSTSLPLSLFDAV